MREGAEREANLMKELNHRNIVKLIDAFEADRKLHIIMEYCPGGDLRKRIKDALFNSDTFTYKQIRMWMIDLTSGLAAIHQHKIIHRDIKPENIFVKGDQVLKIGDLGVGKKVDDEEIQARTRIGTPRYIAPEVYSGRAYSFSADIWSLGIVMLELVLMKAPIVVPKEIENNWLCLPLRSEWLVDIPNISISNYGTQLHKIATDMLTYRAARRPTAHQLERKFRSLPEVHPI